MVHKRNADTQRDHDDVRIFPVRTDYAALFEQEPTPCVVLTPDLVVQEANDAYLKAIVRTRDEIVGRSIFDAVSAADVGMSGSAETNLRASIERALATGRPDEMELLRQDLQDVEGRASTQSVRPINIPVKAAGGDVTVILHRVEDVTHFVRNRMATDSPTAAPAGASPHDLAAEVKRLKASNEQLRQQRDQLAARALRDPLTGALSRSVFHEELTRALSRRSRQPRALAVLFLDLDRLKQVNDCYGHAAGDELIRQTVERMSAGVRPSDAIARMGGDEFVVLLDDLQSPDEAQTVAERLLAKISEPYLLAPGALVYGSASVGIALADTTALTADELLSHADAAMYKAKQSGRGRWELFDAAAYTAANARLQLETELRAAVPNGQLVLHYQPIFNLTSGRPSAVEALLRWRHPSRGTLSAEAFIEVAEDSGVLADIGPWVIDEACRQLAVWDRTLGRRAPQDLYVNLSVGELVRPGLNDSILAAARRAGIGLDRLVIEVTESGMLDKPGSVTDAVDQLLQLGCRVAIDDFGTGYSALSRLVELPADILKIDRSFVRGLSSGPESAAVIAAVLLLAHNLRKTVVAEGVEDSAALATLSELGCEQAQGYFLGRPQPADLITEQLMQPNLVLT